MSNTVYQLDLSHEPNKGRKFTPRHWQIDVHGVGSFPSVDRVLIYLLLASFLLVPVTQTLYKDRGGIACSFTTLFPAPQCFGSRILVPDKRKKGIRTLRIWVAHEIYEWWQDQNHKYKDWFVGWWLRSHSSVSRGAGVVDEHGQESESRLWEAEQPCVSPS